MTARVTSSVALGPVTVYYRVFGGYTGVAMLDDGNHGDGAANDGVYGGFIPAARHKTLYTGAQPSRRGNYAVPPRGKPALERPIPGLKPLGPDTVTRDETIRERLRMLAAVDEGLGRIFAELEKQGTLNQTVVMVIGDNGYFYGEHGLSEERRLAYEESVRLPLLVRYPPQVKAGAEPAGMALTTDLAPTILELAGAPAQQPANLVQQLLAAAQHHVLVGQLEGVAQRRVPTGDDADLVHGVRSQAVVRDEGVTDLVVGDPLAVLGGYHNAPPFQGLEELAGT